MGSTRFHGCEFRSAGRRRRPQLPLHRREPAGSGSK
jgi:hypothetical protein